MRARRWGTRAGTDIAGFPPELGNTPEAAVAPEASGRTVSFCKSDLGAAGALFTLLSPGRKRNCFSLLPEMPPLLRTASHCLCVVVFSLPAFHFLLGIFLSVHSTRVCELGAGGFAGSALCCRLAPLARPGVGTWPVLESASPLAGG